MTICWSSEVVLISIAPEEVNPFAHTCITSLIGAVLLTACFRRRVVAAFRAERSVLARRITLLAALNTTYNILAMIGLDYFDVSAGAFTFSMVVVVLPVLLLVMRRGVTPRTWLSAIIVLSGVCIALSNTADLTQLPGFAIMMTSCILRAVFIVKLNEYAREHDPLTLSSGMLSANAIFSFIPWFIIQPTTFFAIPWTPVTITAMFIYGYFVAAFATVLNVYAQRAASAAQATVIYATEIVFSVIWATVLPAGIIDPVELSPHVIIGCILIVAGNIIEVVPLSSKSDAEEKEAATALHDRNRDPMAQMVAHFKSPMGRRVMLFAMLLIVYLVLALPFKVLLLIPGFTDVRPVCMLMPMYGIFFGIPGCVAFAVGNLITDIVSDSLRWSSIAGFVANFIYPYLLYLFWNKIRTKPFHLRTVKDLCLFAFTVFVSAVVLTALITPAVGFYYPEVDLGLFAFSVIVNNTLFPVVLAAPFIILVQEELGFKPLGYRLDDNPRPALQS